MLLSVVINTYERPAALARCLAALSSAAITLSSAATALSDATAANASPQQTGPMPPLLEVIVVDDGGRADLAPALEQWDRRAGELRLVTISHGGRAAARNRGVAEARGARVLFLGDDVMVTPGCLARHRAVTDRLIAVVGPYPLAVLGGSPPYRRWAEPNPQHEITNPADAGFWFFATGNLSLDRAIILELGGFDERYQRYGWEDIDLGLRFTRAGGRVIFDPAARAVHEHPAPGRAQLWRRERELGYTAWQFWAKWHAAAPAAAAKMRFWNDPATLPWPIPARRRLSRRLIGAAIVALDRLAPASHLNASLYARMVFSHRLEGVAEAWRAEGTEFSDVCAHNSESGSESVSES